MFITWAEIETQQIFGQIILNDLDRIVLDGCRVLVHASSLSLHRMLRLSVRRELAFQRRSDRTNTLGACSFKSRIDSRYVVPESTQAWPADPAHAGRFFKANGKTAVFFAHSFAPRFGDAVAAPASLQTGVTRPAAACTDGHVAVKCFPRRSASLQCYGWVGLQAVRVLRTTTPTGRVVPAAFR